MRDDKAYKASFEVMGPNLTEKRRQVSHYWLLPLEFDLDIELLLALWS